MKMRTFVTAAACAALMIGTSMGVYAQENGQTQLSLPVDNVVEGDVPSDLDYQFILTGENGAPMPADTNDAGDAVLTIKGAGSGNFGAITYTEPENYTYTISEQMDPADHYTFDGTTYTVKVRVFSDENGQLTTAVSADNGDGSKADAIQFVNKYEAPRSHHRHHGGGSESTPEAAVPSQAVSVVETVPVAVASGEEGSGVVGASKPDESGVISANRGLGANKGVRTGDNSQMLLYGGIVVAAAVLIIIWVVVKKRKNRE